MACPNPKLCACAGQHIHGQMYNLWLTNPEYQRLYGCAELLPAGERSPIGTTAAPRQKCVHQGGEIRRQRCPTCSGHVEIKVKSCALHGECTLASDLPGVCCCATCPDHAPGPIDILITGGLGDFLAVESHMPRERVRKIYYATRAEALIRQLVAVGGFPALEEQVSLYSNFGEWWDAGKIFGFIDRAAVESGVRSQGSGVSIPSSVEDWSITPTFPRMVRGELPYRGSWYVQNACADIGHLQLPEEYIAVQAYSPNDGRVARDFSAVDWVWLMSRLERWEQTAVVLGKGGGPVPDHPRIMNLTDKTTVPESIEVLKAAQEYVGIDSWLATPAAQLFDKNHLAVRTRNLHLILCRACYYAPHREFDWLATTFGTSFDVRSLWPSLPA